MADFRTPEVEYKDDVKDPENFVRIEVDIPKLRKTIFGKDAKNAEVVMEYPSSRSFAITVTVKDKGSEEPFKYVVKKLPDDIDKSKSTWNVEKHGVIVLRLRKASPRLWRELASTGLEMGEG